MKKICFLICTLLAAFSFSFAQEKDKDKDKKEEGSWKENLFTGGSVSLAFYNNTFLIGASPVFGYSLGDHVDAGIVVNYNYTAYRDVNTFNDHLHQTVYGGGAFLKLYPVRFLFAQAQVEHNWNHQKYTLPGGGPASTRNLSGNSFLVGGGYTTGRYGKGGNPFFYLAVLFDVGGDQNSPYTDAYGRTIPIIRGGLQIPLFQGKGMGRERR